MTGLPHLWTDSPGLTVWRQTWSPQFCRPQCPQCRARTHPAGGSGPGPRRGGPTPSVGRCPVSASVWSQRYLAVILRLKFIISPRESINVNHNHKWPSGPEPQPQDNKEIKTLNISRLIIFIRWNSWVSFAERTMTQTFPIILFEIFLNVWDVHCESSHQLESLNRIADNSCDVIQVSYLGFIVQ